MRCDECRWSFQATKEKLECRYEPRLVCVQTVLGSHRQSALSNAAAIPVQKHQIATIFPGVNNDWWCSHHAVKLEVIN